MKTIENDSIAMFLGEEDEKQFAIYHPATLEMPTKNCVVVICNPIGYEYYHTHRALRQLAIKLSKQGADVLRFDYYATGDSYGESNSFSLTLARTGLEEAIEKSKTVSGQDKVILLGLRLGASLAFEVSATRDDIKKMILWAPVVKGTELVDDWIKHQQAFEKAMNYPVRTATPDEIMGLPFTSSILSEISEVDLLSLDNVVKEVLLIKSDKDHDTMETLEQQLQNDTSSLSVEQMQGSKFWGADTDDGIVPILTLQKIVDWL